MRCAGITLKADSEAVLVLESQLQGPYYSSRKLAATSKSTLDIGIGNGMANCMAHSGC